MAKYWSGAVSKCDVCGTPLSLKFYDMKTKQGPWGCLCPECAMNGIGIGKVGLGYGQEYTKRENGKWLKTAG